MTKFLLLTHFAQSHSL